MNDWLRSLVTLAEPSVLVSIVEARGSTPREAGAKMVVTAADTVATIGGGEFEYQCVQRARELLEQGTAFRLERFSLGPSLGQCCGGAAVISLEHIDPGCTWVKTLNDWTATGEPLVLVGARTTGDKPIQHRCIVTQNDVFVDAAANQPLDTRVVGWVEREGRRLLSSGQGPQLTRVPNTIAGGIKALFEPILPETFNIVLFGAGHVGKAQVQVLAGLPCRITWVDSRESIFPGDPPSNVTCVHTQAVESAVDDAPPGASFLVMTHSHPLDQAICERIFMRNDFHYCGLIGSRSKRKKFEKRFREHGIPEQLYRKLTCPIGVDGISGKHPAEIAIAVAAELLRVNEQVIQASAGQKLAGVNS